MLAEFAPLVVAVCSNPGEYDHKELQTAATLALAHFMLVRYAYVSAAVYFVKQG